MYTLIALGLLGAVVVAVCCCIVAGRADDL